MREALIAAQAWGGIRPTSLMSTGVPTVGDWSEADRLLVLAWRLDRDALCPGGDHYLDETGDEEGWWKAETIRCDLCAAMDQHREDHKSGPGEYAYAVRDET